MRYFLLVTALALLRCASAQISPEILDQVRQKLASDDVETAFDLIQKAVAQAPASPDALTLLGEVDFRRGQIGAAEMDFKRAINAAKNNAPRAWLGLGRVFDAASYHKKAQICYETAHKLDNSDPAILRAWASTLKRSQQVAALELYVKEAGTLPADTAQSLQRMIDAGKKFGDRPLNRLSHAPTSTTISFLPLMYNANLIRAFGLPVNMNGNKPLKLLLDTGASGILLNPSAAMKLNVEKIGDTHIGGIGDQGEQTAYTGYVESIKVGDVEFSDYIVTVSNKKALGDEDGLIGADVFAQFLVTLDFQRRQLHLDPLPPHQTPSAEGEAEDREISPQMTSFVPIFRIGHALLVPTRVNDSDPALFLIDTGATSSLISTAMARHVTKVHGDYYRSIKGISGRVKDVQSADQFFLSFAGYRQKSEDMTAIDLSSNSHSFGTEISGIIGLPVLSLFNIQIDYRDGLVKFDYYGRR